MNIKPKIIVTLVMVLSTVLFILGIVWLGFVLLVVAGIYLLVKIKNPFFNKLFHSKWVSIPFSVAMIFVIAIFIRLFVIEVFEIPSGSMEDTLLTGDKILVNKLKIGPLTPETPFEVPWFNLLFYMNKEARANMDSIWWKQSRLSGFNKLKRGNIVVFRSVWDKNFIMIKRCIALPGDTVSVVNSELFIDRVKQPDTLGLIKKKYRIYANDIVRQTDSLREQGIYTDIYSDNKNCFFLETNQNILKQLASFIKYDSSSIEVLKPRIGPYCFPYDSSIGWNIDQFGPLWIPKKGGTLKLNEKNYIIYKNVINDLEKEAFEKRDSFFYLREKPITEYTFKNNYCFMMGDNRNYSTDSRFWSFVPEMNIIGEATTVLWSNADGKMKWGRTLKNIE